MKIYFDGGSWCWGSELEDPTQSRYSKIICDHYGIDCLLYTSDAADE